MASRESTSLPARQLRSHVGQGSDDQDTPTEVEDLQRQLVELRQAKDQADEALAVARGALAERRATAALSPTPVPPHKPSRRGDPVLERDSPEFDSHMSNTRSNPSRAFKVNTPHEYYGDRDKLPQYITQIRMYLTMQGDYLDSRRQAIWAASYLRGYALRWWEPVTMLRSPVGSCPQAQPQGK